MRLLACNEALTTIARTSSTTRRIASATSAGAVMTDLGGHAFKDEPEGAWSDEATNAVTHASLETVPFGIVSA